MLYYKRNLIEMEQKNEKDENLHAVSTTALYHRRIYSCAVRRSYPNGQEKLF